MNRDQTRSFLARRTAQLRAFNPMRDAVTQQMFKRRRHAVQHATVHLNGAAQQVKFDLFAGLLRSLANHAIQAIRNAFKLDHPGFKKVTLQLARLARLSDQIVFSRLNGALQRSLYCRHVVDRFRHHAGQLLHAGKAVKLEGIKARLQFLGLRQSRLHLGLSLQLDVAQLLTQAVQVVSHVA